MEPTQTQIDTLWLEDVRSAREMPPSQKLFDGIRLFDQASRWIRAGIRHQNPDADEATVQRILLERIDFQLTRNHQS